MPKIYGLPYKGSKNSIAEWVLSNMPRGEVFIDLFAGGCAITHAALLSGKYKQVIANDINGMPDFFKAAMGGAYHDEQRWITREDFFLLKDTDPYIKYCWSFGNDGLTYFCNRETEPLLRCLHGVFFASSYSEANKYWREFIREHDAVCEAAETLASTILQQASDLDIPLIRRASGGLDYDALLTACPTSNTKDINRLRINIKKALYYEKLINLSGVDSIEPLIRLERIKALEGLNDSPWSAKLSTCKGSYLDVPIPDKAVIYCDPPYFNTSGYGVEFDHGQFYDWLRALPQVAFISVYSMPDDFAVVAQQEKLCGFAASGNSMAVEKLYVYQKWADGLRRVEHQQTLL